MLLQLCTTLPLRPPLLRLQTSVKTCLLFQLSDHALTTRQNALRSNSEDTAIARLGMPKDTPLACDLPRPLEVTALLSVPLIPVA
jgi:hypothetical protein